MQTRFEVYEAHLSFLLQFMCDYGLYGCGELDISGASFRRVSDAESAYEDELRGESLNNRTSTENIP